MVRRLAVLALLAPVLITGAQAPAVCTRTGSKVTIQAPSRDSTCVLKSGAVSYTITIAATPKPATPSSGASSSSAGSSTPSVPVTPSQPTTASLAFSDFSTGLGPYSTPWPDAVTLIDDPTGSNRGRVVQVTLAGGGSVIDINRAFYLTGVALPAHFFFAGDVYLPANTVALTNSAAQRKLIYLSANSGNNQVGFVVLKMWGNQLAIEWGNGVDDIQTYGLGTVSGGAWHHVEVEVQRNSAFSASDGALRVWLDGKPVYEKLNWRAFTRGTQTYDMIGVGYQREGVAGESRVSEVRYWDRVGFSTARIP